MSTAWIITFYLLYVVLAAASAVVTVRMALGRRRDGVFWFFLGYALPILAPLGFAFVVRHRDDIRHAERVRWYEWSWVRWPLRFVASMISMPASAAGLYMWIPNETTRGIALATIGVFIGVWAFQGLLALFRLMLILPWQPLAVARSVIEEALRMKLALVFAVLVLVVVPVLPFVLSEDQPLRYRMQQFISWSMIAVTFLLSLMTVLLACWTLSREVEKKQVYITLVKPVNRAVFIFGKWLGVVLFNAALLLVAAAGIYGFTVFYLARQPVADAYDPLAVQEELLTARVAIEPEPPVPFGEAIDQQIERMAREEPDRLITLGQEVAQEQSRFGLGRQQLIALGAERAKQSMGSNIVKSWRSLGPYGSRSAAAMYVFNDVQFTGFADRTVTLRYKIKGGGAKGEPTKLGLMVNGQRIGAIDAVSGITQRWPVPASLVDDSGRLEMVIMNLNPERSISFPSGDLQVLYRQGTFTGNFVRAMLVVWIKLAFLAALGLAAASFLGFPVASMASLLIYLAAATSNYILESLGTFAQTNPTDTVTFMEVALKWLAWAFTMPLQVFSTFSPTTSLVEGLYIPWGQVGRAALWIGLAWTGATVVVGMTVFTRRELARVQV